MALFDKFTKKTNTALDPTSVLPAIFEALAREGYRPKRSQETRIMYKVDGLVGCFFYREDDPEFLMVRAFYERKDYERYDEALLLKACVQADLEQKVGKVCLDDDGDIVLAVEAFIFPGVSIGRLALRMSKALSSVDACFHRALKQITQEQEEATGSSKTDSSQLPPSGSLPS